LSLGYYINVVPEDCLPHPPGLQNWSGGWRCRCSGYHWSQLSHSQLTNSCKAMTINIS